MLALPSSCKILGDKKVECSPICTLTRNFEPAGHTYEHKLDLKLGYTKLVDEEAENITDDIKDDESIPINIENLDHKRRKQSWVDKAGFNFYEILNLPSRSLVTDEMIRKSYMKLAIQNHPDKMAEKYDETAKKKWLNVT